jgi:hypothetical protein
MPNPVCQSCNQGPLIDGAIQSTGSIYFRPASTPFLTFTTADIAVHASMCASCGSVQLIGDSRKLRQLKTDSNKVPAKV